MRRCRFLTSFLMVILLASYISSFIVIIGIVPRKTVHVVTDDLMAEYHRRKCVNSSFGIPSSLVKFECLGRSCQYVTCDKLFDGDRTAIAAAQIFERKSLSDEEVYKYAMDCSRLQDLGEYQMMPVRAADADFPIAFTILLHLNSEQFERLLRAIYRPQNVYCVHVDTKSPESFQSAVKAIIKCLPNVFLATRLHYTVYTGFSRLQADVDCMKDHLAQNVNWHYVINLPGQAYPLRTPEEMVDILRIYNGANDIEGIYLRRLTKRYVHKWKEWFENGTSGVRLLPQWNPQPPHGIDIVRGSAYGIFSRKFVEFVVDDQRAKDLLNWSRDTYSPDEHYWATLHHTLYNPQLNTPGGYPGNADKKEFMAVYVKWQSGSRCICEGKYVRYICILGVGDLHELLPRREFFVNKFDLTYEPLAFECAERWLQHRVHCPVAFDARFYQSLSFVVAHNNKLSN